MLPNIIQVLAPATRDLQCWETSTCRTTLEHPTADTSRDAAILLFRVQA